MDGNTHSPDMISVLIVDDEVTFSTALEEMLTHIGYRVTGSCTSGESAVEKAGELEPDLVLMDIKLEGEMNGLTAAGIIKDRFSTPVIFITASTDQETIAAAKRIEPYGYLVKPFGTDKLAVILEIALHRREVEKGRKAAEEALRRERDLWKQTFDAIPDLLCILNRDREIERANRALCEGLGCTGDQIAGRACYHLLHDSSEPPELCPHQLAILSQENHNLEIYEEKLGGHFLVTASLLNDEAGALTGTVHMARDITARKKAEAALQHAHDMLEEKVRERTAELEESNSTLMQEVQERRAAEKELRTRDRELEESRASLQKLAGRLIAAQENERRIIARELHDDLTQRLAVLAIDIRKIEHTLEDQPETVKNALSHARADVIKLSGDIHSLSRQLHPSIINDLGPVRAIESECMNFTKREGITVDFVVEGPPFSLHPDKAICLYRILQESLRNIARHADVKSARVMLAVSPHELVLTIADRGKGFARNSARKTPGIGLASMRERAYIIGSTLSIESAEGLGTTVMLTIPLDQEVE